MKVHRCPECKKMCDCREGRENCMHRCAGVNWKEEPEKKARVA